MDTVVNANSAVYYSGHYWNDLPRVVEYMCENFTGDKHKWWMDDFRERFCAAPFQRVLVLNCGNGWVERELVDKGIAAHVAAFDYSLDLLRTARRDMGDRPIHYFQTDVNVVDFPANSFDLVVNVAALHHVHYIDRLCRILCSAVRPGGMMVSFDYVGPRRNQYPLRQWYHIQRANRALPAHMRKVPLVRPHLPTMMYTDPTEAIHSDLIFQSLARYFDVFERHDTGGGIAYELLTHNKKLWSIAADELNPHLDRLLAMDKQHSESGAVPVLFSYFIARPAKQVLSDDAALRRHEAEEAGREAWGRAHGGAYSYVEFVMARGLPLLAAGARRIRTFVRSFRKPS